MLAKENSIPFPLSYSIFNDFNDNLNNTPWTGYLWQWLVFGWGHVDCIKR